MCIRDRSRSKYSNQVWLHKKILSIMENFKDIPMTRVLDLLFCSYALYTVIVNFLIIETSPNSTISIENEAIVGRYDDGEEVFYSQNMPILIPSMQFPSYLEGKQIVA